MKLLRFLLIGSLAIPLFAFAQNRPSDALPPGTYKKSCGECKISGGQYLVCKYCKDGKNKVSGPLGPTLGGGWEEGVSLDLNSCKPNEKVWNHNGQLECGHG